MFYYLMRPLTMYNGILVAAAVVPAILLMVRVYRSDRLEKEDMGLLRRLVRAGILAALLALVEERILSEVLNAFRVRNPVHYNLILYFGVVACSEESSKYLFMRRETWKSPQFNCQYDGVVYAVFASLGFALWENISYVLSYGLSVALVRAITAIPGHACFGVFMGVFYGLAKRYDRMGNDARSRYYRGLALIVPILLHGAYDYIASLEMLDSGWYFLLFVLALFILSNLMIRRYSRQDRYI